MAAEEDQGNRERKDNRKSPAARGQDEVHRHSARGPGQGNDRAREHTEIKRQT